MENPYLAGPYGPVSDEASSDDLRVIGEIPRDLAGMYVRNGPNRKHAAPGRYHWFDGDGMLHAIRFEDGDARYQSRWVRTDALRREDEAGGALWRGLMESTRHNPADAPYKDTANTDVVFHGGELLALWYICGAAHRVGIDELDTRGVLAEPGGKPLRLSAHAKADKKKNELLFFDYGLRPPFMRYGVVEADGTLAHHVPVDLPGPRLPHDMAFTEKHAVLMDLPVFYRPEALEKKKWIVGYYPEIPARFGIIPRRGAPESIRWFEAEPCYIYHVVNAWDEGDKVVMIACRCTDPTPEVDPADGDLARMLANLRLRATLHRWTFDLGTGETHEEQLDDLSAEFPAINLAHGGRRSRYSYHVRIPKARTLVFDGIVKYDLESGGSEVFELPEGCFGSEVAFAPRQDGVGEDDGYLVSYVDDRDSDRSECWVLDARAVSAGPIAKVELPRRVPLGFHATWVTGNELARAKR
jgi:carotenoid cleavage dioxygenase